MADRYCRTCGAPLAADAHFCARCGAPAAAPPAEAWSGGEETYVPGRSGAPPPGYASQAGTSGPYPTAHPATSGPIPPVGPPPRRGPSATALLAGGAVVLAVAAAAVALLVTPGGTSHRGAPPPSSAPAGSGGTPGSSAASRSDGLAGPSPTGGQVSTAIGSTTLAAPGAADTVPRTTAALRAAYASGTPVDPGSYADGSAVAFVTPSQNIECVATTEGTVALTCAIGVYDFPQPGPDCTDGAVLTINGYGNAGYAGCLTAPFAPGSRTLDYGGSLAAGQFGCVSRSVGVTCLDLATSTGFTLSKQQFVPVN